MKGKAKATTALAETKIDEVEDEVEQADEEEVIVEEKDEEVAKTEIVVATIEVKTKKRKIEKIVEIHCEWESCENATTLHPLEYDTFSQHLKHHVDEFVAHLKAETEEPSEEKPLSCCCLWRGCTWEGCEDLKELTRHIMFHGYHSLLRALGKLEQDKMSLNTCNIEQEDQYHMLSCVTTPYLCLWSNCSEEYSCPDKFYRHVEAHVLNSEFVYDENSQYRMQCFWSTCTNTFRDKHKLKEHVRTHTHEKLVACPGCGGLFSNRTKLMDHLSRQNAQAYEHFQCSHCLKRCASERLLRDHMRHHVNYLKCPHCDMTCPNPGSLKYHIHYRHSDERPYHCAMCDNSFKSNSDLLRHEESHLPKSYLCTFAGCSFTTKTSHCLKRHMKITHSENGTKRYICHICNHAYSRGFGLTKHLKKKHNFSWPSGHPRFRYIEYEDGYFRLQMVRFESVELTKRLKSEEKQTENQDKSTKAEGEEGHTADEYVVDNLYDGIIHVDNPEQLQQYQNIEVTYDPAQGILCAVNKEDGTRSEVVYNQKEVSNEVEIECEANDVLQIVEQNAIEAEGEEKACTSNENKDVYLQPKPAGFDMSVMAQLIALSTGKQQNSATSALVSDLYKRILKQANAMQNASGAEDEEATENLAETANQLGLDEIILATTSDTGEGVVFEQIATCPQDNISSIKEEEDVEVNEICEEQFADEHAVAVVNVEVSDQYLAADNTFAEATDTDDTTIASEYALESTETMQSLGDVVYADVGSEFLTQGEDINEEEQVVIEHVDIEAGIQLIAHENLTTAIDVAQQEYLVDTNEQSVFIDKEQEMISDQYVTMEGNIKEKEQLVERDEAPVLNSRKHKLADAEEEALSTKRSRPEDFEENKTESENDERMDASQVLLSLKSSDE